jgi:hypothetical protein
MYQPLTSSEVRHAGQFMAAVGLCFNRLPEVFRFAGHIQNDVLTNQSCCLAWFMYFSPRSVV